MKALTECASCALAMIVANFAWQSATDHLWRTAFERSWFQLVPIILLAWTFRKWRPQR